MSMANLLQKTVLNFPQSISRAFLFSELERLHVDLTVTGLICELWINGSFLTEKLDPNDIDLSFACFYNDFEMLDSTLQANVWSLLNGGKRYSPVLDTYICFRFLRDDPRAMADGSRDWSEKWSVGWDDWLKGFAIIKLGETDVGLRLFT